MATESIRVSATIPASPQQIYGAWLDGAKHTKMTGGAATGEPRVGAKHSSWDGYIFGETLELDDGRRVVQSWRATDFPEDAGDSRVVVHLEPEGDGTRLTIEHTDLPEGSGDRFTTGWDDFYFKPMKKYFGNLRRLAAARPAAKPAAEPAFAKAAPAVKAAPAAKAKAAAKPKSAAKPKAKAATKAKPTPKKRAAKAKAASARPAKKAPAKRASAKKTAKKVSRKAKAPAKKKAGKRR